MCVLEWAPGVDGAAYYDVLVNDGCGWTLYASTVYTSHPIRRCKGTFAVIAVMDDDRTLILNGTANAQSGPWC